MITLCAWKCGKVLAWLLCSFFLLLAFGQTCRAEENYVITGNELSQLNEIFEKLETLNAKLQNELTISRKSLQQLDDELTKLKADLAELQATLARSEAESMQLRELLLKAESSLTRLETSFAEYRSAAESRIRTLARQRNLAILIAVLAVIV